MNPQARRWKKNTSSDRWGSGVKTNRIQCHENSFQKKNGKY